MRDARPSSQSHRAPEVCQKNFRGAGRIYRGVGFKST